MTNDAMAFFKGLPDHLAERTRMINQRPVSKDGSFVLYWMHHAVRGHENPALDVAVCVANQLRQPVLVYQGLGGWHPYNSDRHHTFILEGAIDVHAELADRGIAHLFYLSSDPQGPSPIRRLMAQAAATVTEDFPMPPFTSWTQNLAQSAASAFWVVDSACIVPMRLHNKAFKRAYRFRQETQRLFQERLQLHHESPQPLAAPFKRPEEIGWLDLEAIDVPEVVSQCRIDHTVGPVSGTRGGSVAGYHRWEQFKVHGLLRYAELRNDAAVSFPMGVSRMSAYLHHGHVAPFRLAREATAQGGTGAEKYLDELLIWRELAHNY